jgi:hypothetical protein
MSNATTRLKATLGTMLETMLCTVLQATLGTVFSKAKMDARRHATAKMRTGFFILTATHGLQNSPAWLKLEKLRFVHHSSCHPT